MDEQERTARAREAKRILEHEVFQEAQARYRDSLFRQFEDSEYGDFTLWSNLHAQLHATKGVQGALKSFRTDGDKAVISHARRTTG